MPSIYYLNPPPNPFWDFVASMEDHPLITGGGPSRRSGPPFGHRYSGHPHHQHHGPPPPPPAQNEAPAPAQEQEKNEAAAATESNEKGKGKQAFVDEDPPEVDPSTVKPASAPTPAAAANANSNAEQAKYPEFPTWGYDMIFGNRNNEGQDGSDGPQHRRGPGCRGRGFGPRGGHHGPPPFMMGGGPAGHGPWWTRRGGPPGQPGAEHQPQEGPGHGPHGGPWWARRGPPCEGNNQQEGPGPHRHHHGGPGRRGCGRGPRHAEGQGHGHGPRGGSPPAQPQRPSNFNLGDFLNNLGQRLGVDLSAASEALGGDRFTGPRTHNSETDFEPHADIFDTPTSYLIHLSLPGAKKEDVGVDWDGENSVLRIAGVVHRPGVDETLMSQLVVDGRKRETGVFERTVRLGTRRDPASIDIAGITAKMTDGVLVVKVPKVEPKHEKREVPISSASGSGAGSPESKAIADDKSNDSINNEKQRDLLFDADDEEMLDVPSSTSATNNHNVTTALPHRTPAPETNKEKEKEKEEHRDDRSETLDHEEQLPKYEGEAEEEEFHDGASDWERYGSDDEGDFVKITVN